MCIIITKEKGAKPIEKKIFENCWDNNPDGAGILYHDGKSSTLIKGIMKKEDFLQKVDLANKKECSFVIHTRIATHGSVKPDNTHPFVSNTLGFAHNGTMPVVPLEDKTDSESFFLWTIADKDMAWCKENKFLLDMATHNSRCVVFDMETGELLHLCKEDWKEDKDYPGYMFSNSSYTYQKWLPGTCYSTGKGYDKYGNYGSYGHYDSETNRYYDDFWNFDDDYEDTKDANKLRDWDKDALSKIRIECLKKNKNDLLIPDKDFAEMYLGSFAEQAETDKKKMKLKIQELEAELIDNAKYYGKYVFETNAISVIKQFLSIAYEKRYRDYTSVRQALKEFIKGIYPETSDEQSFHRSLEMAFEDYK
jgi:hypothetical protein